MSDRSTLSLGVISITVTVGVANLGNNIVAPIMPAIKEQFGANAAQVGLVVSGFAFGRLLMDLPSGYLTERISSTKLFAAGILMTACASALAAMATSMEQIILFRTMMGLGASIMSTVGLISLIGISRPDQRGTVLSFFTTALLMSQALSPSIGGYLANLFGWRSAFVFCAFTPLISLPLNLIVNSRAARVHPPEVQSPRPLGKNKPLSQSSSASPTPDRVNGPALITVYFTNFVNFFNRQGMRSSILPLYGGIVLGLDAGTIGALLTTGAVVTLIATMPCGVIADRVGKKPLLIPGLLSLSLGNLSLLMGGGQTMYTLAILLICMGSLSNSMMSALMADFTPDPMVGRAMGMFRFTGDLGMVVGPFALGLALDRFGFPAAMILGALVVLTGVIASLALIPGRTIPTFVRAHVPERSRAD